MVDNLWWISIAAGLSDAINPCVFAVIAVFLVIYHATDGKRWWLYGAFVLLAMLGVALLNAGMDIYIPTAPVVFKTVDGLLSLVFILYAWHSGVQFQAQRGGQAVQPLPGQRFCGAWFRKRFINAVVVFFLALGMAILVSQWPADYQFSVLCNSFMVASRWVDLAVMVIIYTAALFSPLWFVMGVFYDQRFSSNLKRLMTSVIMASASMIGVLILK